MSVQCPACGQPARQLEFCTGCQADLSLRGVGCRFCGTPVPYSGAICGRCLNRTHSWDHLHFVQDFRGPWAALIRRLKYNAVIALAYPLAALLADQWRRHHDDRLQVTRNWQVVAMPMHSKRLTERGFNQAGLVADAMAERLALPRRQPLYRTCDTPALEGLNRVERQRAVGRAFASEPAAGHWLLVDDVFTTGASAEAAARSLRSAGAQSVALLMLARTPLSADSHHNSLLAALAGTPGAADAPENPPHSASRS